mmetsp:Transcript_44644/g.69849  ORF Transcript_44644/g.69849 Transcript_44644/m.69849 type:complete len:291 (-) Transcript_44644:161-1033(-)|eukprot:CAMPEP_0184308682 /NCGR_PEP_ID=MMETSP1049-20130417/17064_1 /TAXON_ID=77928 /ORGANISM="Proteomonas sulcata, Strain CCMP704" /LENGTH=290 /DNA_ID=CAMNT_0026621409 /DNA_START=220 /DNA_END=1092 /DNA_ORIENTATION=+
MKFARLVPVLALSCFLSSSEANKGYDKEENPANVFKGYCVSGNYPVDDGLCAGLGGKKRLCAASDDSEHPLSAQSWFMAEVNGRRDPHTERSLQKGGKAFNDLQVFFTNRACKQLGENFIHRIDLTDDQKQEAACNFVWRRDQEIQNEASPTPGAPWGTFTYIPPGENITRFVFKGMPKNQCNFDYDCRSYNDPGQVNTCCDYCEYYFSTFCEVDYETVFQFCMEKVHCVCNSVTKKCAKPDKQRGVSEKFPDGKMYPVHGAPCSSAKALGPTSLGLLVLFLGLFNLARY